MPFFDRDHLQSNMGIISGPGSFAVQFGDHLQSGIICGPGIICRPIQIQGEGCTLYHQFVSLSKFPSYNDTIGYL